MQSSTDAATVRRIIERWVRAVDAADLPGVLAGHTDDVVMFDVPAPTAVAGGIDAYAATWQAFLAWQVATAASSSPRCRSPPGTTSAMRTPCCGAAAATTSPGTRNRGCA